MSSTPGAFARAFQCECCKNPWNIDDATGVSTPDKAKSDGAMMLCSPCLADSKGYSGIDPSNFDMSVKPSENFYLWSNGGWKEKNPIPSEYSSWNTFIALRDLNMERLKLILDELEESKGEDSAIATNPTIEKVKMFFQGFMDVNAIEASGIQELNPVFRVIQNIKYDIAGTIAYLHGQVGLSVLFSLYSTPDKSNSNHTIASLYQGGLGMPDRDYYFDKDKADKREKYMDYITNLFVMIATELPEYQEILGDSEETSRKIAQSVLSFETKLAQWHLTRTEARDPKLTYNKMPIAKLMQMSRDVQENWNTYLARGVSNDSNVFDWPTYFSSLQRPVESLGDINVACTTYLTHFSELFSSSALVPYLFFHAVNSFAPHLSSAYVNAHFSFHEQALKGTAEILPRWKRGLQAIDASYILGEALGQLYVQRYFQESAKKRALYIVESVRKALEDRLHEVEWMLSPKTREHALEKMRGFKIKIGYPDQWQSADDLQLFAATEQSAAVHLLNVQAVRAHSFARDLQRMNAPTDKSRWFMTPQTVNAYYHPSLNEIVFPAAILQPPFFDAEADEAVQFGSLGAVVGHEMTHGFDDQGRKYDAAGNLRDWWSPEDGAEYAKRAQRMIDQAAAFTVYDVALNGNLTCGENIADLGGVKLALKALNHELSTQQGDAKQEKINGLTPHQRFFIAWSQSWRENVKKERALQLVTLDPHGPNEWRCNGPLSNIEEFHQAFHVQPGDTMYRPLEDRVDIW